MYSYLEQYLKLIKTLGYKIPAFFLGRSPPAVGRTDKHGSTVNQHC